MSLFTIVSIDCVTTGGVGNGGWSGGAASPLDACPSLSIILIYN